MRKQCRGLLALGAFFLVGAALAGCGSGVPGNSAAAVAGNPITLQAVNHWMYIAAKSQAAQSPGAPVIVPNDPPDFKGCIAQARKEIPSLAKSPDSQLKTDCKQLFTSLSAQVMTYLIKAYWYQLEAARLHVTPTDAQVQQAFQQAKNQQFKTPAQFQTFLSQTGQTLQDILFRFRINQTFQALMKKYTSTVTPAQISAYYQSHLSQFGTPETRNIQIVLTKTQGEANAAKGAIAGGQSWAAVAKKYSIDPTSKNNGGELTGVSKGQQDQALDNAAFSAPPNQVLGPVKGQFGYYVFRVTKINKGKQQSLAQATPLIRQTLTGQQQATSQQTVDKMASQRWMKRTSCRSQYMVPQCNGFTPPKTTSNTAPTPSAPTPSAPNGTPPPTPGGTPPPTPGATPPPTPPPASAPPGTTT
jgi:foldase protein PrsA